jgi:uncharacterized protein YndB with AHSA1/START domain
LPVIEHEVEIEAAPEAVFALISRVEDFALYSDSVESVTPLGNDRYRWQVRAVGMSLSFEVEVTEVYAPRTSELAFSYRRQEPWQLSADRSGRRHPHHPDARVQPQKPTDGEDGEKGCHAAGAQAQQ